jgi:cytochrome c peroxidase
MKAWKRVLLFAVAGIASVSLVHAAEKAFVAKGKTLFNDPKLGFTGKTCQTCHPDGKGLEQAGGKANLEDIINNCIMGPLKGKELEPKSAEMQSLVLYVKSLSAKKPAANK